jgi:hypothetical protein
VDSTHHLQGPDTNVDEVSDDNDADNIEQSSVTESESDDDVVVVESDDPFVDDIKVANSKLLKKLDSEVHFFSIPALTV